MMMNKIGFNSSFTPNEKWFKKVSASVPKRVFEQRISSLRKDYYNGNG